jgi:hypothetical protein
LNPKNDKTQESISHRPLESAFKTSLPYNKLNNVFNCAETEFPNEKMGCLPVLGADTAADQTKLFNTASEVSPNISLLGSNHRRRVAPLALSPIKPSSQIQIVRLKKLKLSINPNIRLNLDPKGLQGMIKCQVIR